MAPMAGITDRTFRNLVSQYGADVSFCEMVSAKGLYYSDESTKRLLDIEGEANVGIQIFGSEPDIISEVVDFLNENYDYTSLDLNAGCPAPKVYNNGDGAALMRDPALIGEITRVMVEKSKVPVSVKFRLGISDDSINYLEVGRICQEAGAERVTLHGRTKNQYYRGKADWEAIKKLTQALDIPVVGNGDIFSGEDARNMIEYTGCDSVMIARGALGRPFIFREIKDVLEGREPKLVSDFEILDTMVLHYEKMKEEKPEIFIREMRKHAAWYLKGMKGSNEYKDKINKLKDYDDVLSAIQEYKNLLAG